MEKVYISAPVSGYNIQERRDFFREVAEGLRDQGFEICNPLEYASDNDDYEACMKRDIRMLLDCDAIAMCDGWTESDGCKIEYSVAQVCGLKAYRVHSKTVQVRKADVEKFKKEFGENWRVALYADENIKASMV